MPAAPTTPPWSSFACDGGGRHGAHCQVVAGSSPRPPGGSPRRLSAGRPPGQWSRGILNKEELIGLIALRRRSPSMGTISYILREDTWGNGYTTHAAQQVVVLAFTSAGLNRLEAMHHPDNPASGRVLTKAGFTRADTSDRHTEDGTAVPYPVYALSAPPTSGRTTGPVALPN
ncbi:GNAT family N-acetyltransferase [Streptomyces sp. NPDC057963]|uniref:GNAT family N-acetyltransferase n=1 Tax=Streptomyces sp. NPDC057963 TaxID=3346290 RepID=UPI0036E019EC